LEVLGLGHVLIIAFAAFLLFFQFGMRYVITYNLTDTRLEVRLFGFLPVSRTRYDLVDEVRVNDYLKAFFWPLLWVWMINRLVGSFIVVRRGPVVLVISPAKPQEFARELSIRVQEWTGQWPLAS
jgi:hypothetical protein